MSSSRRARHHCRNRACARGREGAETDARLTHTQDLSVYLGARAATAAVKVGIYAREGNGGRATTCQKRQVDGRLTRALKI